MKKVVKIVGVMLSILIIGVWIAKEAYALSFKFELTANNTVVHAGDTIVVSMVISDISMGNLGINAIESILDYDDKVFEIVDREDITMQNNWTMTYNKEAGPHNGNFLVSNLAAGIKEKQKIGEITFKIKEDIKPTTTEIKFKKVTSNNGKDLVNIGDRSIQIKIVEKASASTGTNGGANGGTNTGTNTNTGANIKPIGNNKVTISSVINNTNKMETVKNTTAEGDIPYTGIDEVITISLAILGIVAVVTYINYKRIEIK